MNNKVRLTVTASQKVETVKILPSALNLSAKIEGNSLFIELDKPQHITIEVNGNWHESLHVFANPFEENIPNPNDPNVVYFGPGIHEVTTLKLTDNQTLYLAGGAYIKGSMDPNESPQMVGGKKMFLPTLSS